MEEVATMPSNAQEFCLRWNNFHSSLVSALDGFKNDLDFVDVTLACEGQFLKAHKMLLSACSVFFRDLLKANPCQHPIVILPPEVRFIDLEKMLRFIYQGEVNVQQENLARFLKTAEMLKIRGLAEDGEKQRVLQAASPRPSEMSGNGSTERCNNDASAVSPKRPRLSLDAQSGQSTDQPQTPNDESRLSGPDSDSEMIPVKQEMIELKECDFESADSEAFLAAETCYLRENSVGTTNNSSSNNNNNSSISSSNNNSSSSSTTQPPLTHPAAPPPPGPLLPSYVPPPQIKAQDDSPLPPNPDDLSQGTATRLAPDLSTPHGGGEGKEVVMWKPGQTPKSSSSSPRFVFSYSTPSGKFQSSSNKKSPNSNSPSPRVSPAGGQPQQKSKAKKSPGAQRVSPGQNSSARRYSPGSSSVSAVTGSSRSIWHPPTFSNEEEIKDFSNSPPVTPVSSQQRSSSTSPASNSLTCDICSKTFTSKSNLNKHKRVQHSGEEYMCPLCKRSFKNRYYIKDHLNLCLAPHKKSPLSAASSLQSLDDRSSVDFSDSQVDDT